jgi:hypothetical protein
MTTAAIALVRLIDARAELRCAIPWLLLVS